MYGGEKENAKELYGVEPMNIVEEFELANEHPNKAKTRNNKIRMCEALFIIKTNAEILEKVIKSIPEEDNDHHAEIVNNMAEELIGIRRQLATLYDRHAIIKC